jgi:hypothetical protein
LIERKNKISITTSPASLINHPAKLAVYGRIFESISAAWWTHALSFLSQSYPRIYPGLYGYTWTHYYLSLSRSAFDKRSKVSQDPETEQHCLSFSKMIKRKAGIAALIVTTILGSH